MQDFECLVFESRTRFTWQKVFISMEEGEEQQQWFLFDSDSLVIGFDLRSHFSFAQKHKKTPRREYTAM